MNEICKLCKEFPITYTSFGWCNKCYLKERYKKQKDEINVLRREEHANNPEKREETNKRNREAGQRRREAGVKRVRKPYSEWTEEEKAKGRERKRKHQEKQGEAGREKTRLANQVYHKAEYAKKVASGENEEIKKTIMFQFSSLKTGAKRRTKPDGSVIHVLLTKEQFTEKRTSPCYYCGHELPETGYCLDRLHPQNDYTMNDCVPCCHMCQYMKTNLLTPDETMAAGLAVRQYHVDSIVPPKIVFALGTSNPVRDRSNSGYVKLCKRAEIKNIEKTLTEKEYNLLVSFSCTYCGGPLDKAGAGIDRMNSKLGYHFDNCTSCCGFCNDVKNDMLTFEEALVAINAIQKCRISKL